MGRPTSGSATLARSAQRTLKGVGEAAGGVGEQVPEGAALVVDIRGLLGGDGGGAPTTWLAWAPSPSESPDLITLLFLVPYYCPYHSVVLDFALERIPTFSTSEISPSNLHPLTWKLYEIPPASSVRSLSAHQILYIFYLHAPALSWAMYECCVEFRANNKR
ncbi:hypothetical protein VPH35_013492 [Triticum aestivum]